LTKQSDLLLKQRVAVSIEGTLVVLKVGNSELKMDYETAIQISTWLRVRGKQAKRLAGDTSRHWSVIGLLEGIEAGERPF
jgi:hypothetical protein